MLDGTIKIQNTSQAGGHTDRNQMNFNRDRVLHLGSNTHTTGIHKREGILIFSSFT